MKKLLMTRRFALGLTVAAAAALISGCATCKPDSTPKLEYFPITVILDDSLKDSSMQVDLVGVNGASLPRLNGYSMTQYWKDGDATRKDADKVTFSFLDGKKVTETLPKTHSKWAGWKAKGVTHVVVLSNLPGANPDKTGNQDARRATVWLNKCKWVDGTTSITLRVLRSGIVIETPIRPGWETKE